MNPVVSISCDEPTGDVVRHVYPMVLSPENLLKFWQKSSKYRTLFTDDINGDFAAFCRSFISQVSDREFKAHGLFWVIDDFVGIYYMTHIFPHEATIHYTFFDGRTHGREKMTKAMIKYVFETFDFRRLNIEIPAYASPSTLNFVTINLKARQEGRKRKAVPYKGDWYDVKLFGILREEAESWVLNTVKSEVAPQSLLVKIL